MKFLVVFILVTKACAAPAGLAGWFEKMLEAEFNRTGFAQALDKAITTDAKGNNHLYFYSLDQPVPSLKRCGEVDAAPYMPASLFEPANRVQLEAYAAATIKLYKVSDFSGTDASQLKLGRCSSIGYTVGPAGIQGIVWAPSSLMGPVCSEECNCDFNGAHRGLPSCKDVPDKPSEHQFCSLCGPTTSCPTCSSGTVTISLYYPPEKKSPPPPPPPPAAKTIVDLAVATPDLSTLVTALKAGDLVDTLSGKGPFTVFAPTNEAFAALPAGVLTNLLKPENKAQLVDILTYHVASGDVHSKDLKDMEMIKTVEGKSVEARVSGSTFFINSAEVTAADNDASNGVVHIIDAVLMPGSAPKPNVCEASCEASGKSCNCKCFCSCDSKCGTGCYDTCRGAGFGSCFSDCPQKAAVELY